MDDFDGMCTVTIDGTYAGEYYVPANTVGYLVSGTLQNKSSNTITLYPVGSTSTYPRIQISAFGDPYYYTGSNYNGVHITDISTTSFNLAAQSWRVHTSGYDTILLLAVCVMLLFCNLFRRH